MNVQPYENSISVRNLCRSFGDFKLDHISLDVPKGRIVGFIGENGAGKSTTIRLILNELQKDSGEITVLGRDFTSPDVKSEIGVVFDECSFHDFFCAKDIGKIFSGVYSSWDRAYYEDCLRRFKIAPKKPVGELSRGMNMKLSIICAMAHRPKLLILDEATTGLDPVVRDEMLDLFLDFIQDEEHSIFLSSHITSDIEKIADYVILIHKGQILFEELKDDLIFRYGILKCEKGQFPAVSPDDYIAVRERNTCMECLVPDRETAARKYRDMIVDRTSLEEIMLFYIKGGNEE